MFGLVGDFVVIISKYVVYLVVGVVLGEFDGGWFWKDFLYYVFYIVVGG